MFVYEKKLQYPVKIKTPNAAMAKFIIAQYGGPSGEAGAAMRYLSQRFSMPYSELKAVYTDIGTEELSHLEIVGTIVHQLTKGLSEEELMRQGFSEYFGNISSIDFIYNYKKLLIWIVSCFIANTLKATTFIFIYAYIVRTVAFNEFIV